MQWTEDLAVGVEAIDSQHKELFRRINGLVDAIGQGKCKSVIDSVITFLEDYAVVHFSAEESSMVKNAYPEYDQHRKQHSLYLANLSDLKKELAEDGPSYVLSVTTNQVVVDWIISHILQTDMKFGEYLKKIS
ncbi:MAG: bacteriohemerythrin [Nitrospirae bacterium]|nr:bacteriohemerythrin [Nitrospirota bacterium]